MKRRSSAGKLRGSFLCVGSSFLCHFKSPTKILYEAKEQRLMKPRAQQRGKSRDSPIIKKGFHLGFHVQVTPFTKG